MKKLVAFVLLFSMVLATSCTSVYNTSTLNNKYDNRMGLYRGVQSKIGIYLAENDIPYEYEVISINRYKPFTLLGFIPYVGTYFQKKKMTKTFYKKAVLKADSERGDAVYITAPGDYKVIRYIINDTPSTMATQTPAPVVAE
ncbi:MAG: hypothetical protein J6K24_02875 [Tidjanibacter sp.]|nr:hypothetical protein [Tidjanibacter sp.]